MLGLAKGRTVHDDVFVTPRHARRAAGNRVPDPRRPEAQRSPPTDGPADAWLTTVADAASKDSGGVPQDLLGEYLPMLAVAASTGRRPPGAWLEAVRALGIRAAEQGVSADALVNLYLSAAWRLWTELPLEVRKQDGHAVRVATDAVLHVTNDAVATLADGYGEARRRMVRSEETSRRELIDDLLRGDSHLGELVERTEPFGLDLTRRHRTILAAPNERLPDVEAATSLLERRILDWVGDRDVLVATKDGLLVVIAPAGLVGPGQPTPREAVKDDIGALIEAELSRLSRGGPWRVTVGRPYPGAYGIARSYEEAREALTMTRTLNLDARVTHAEDLLIYRVLLRDQPAIVDLVHTVLGPLALARDGAAPLLDTLSAYFEVGGVATEAAARLHLSVRAVTYRLERVRTLTGYDPTSAAHRFTIHAAVLGAKLLGWPQRDLAA
jgi:sugar diacid utilization regulator